jgi:membrane protein
MRAEARALGDFVQLMYFRLRDDRLAQIAGSLAFTSLLALVPLITIALTMFSAFPAFAGLWSAIRGFILSNLVPAAASKVIGVYINQFTANAGKLTALGLVVLGVSAVMTMLTIERTFNRVWRVRRPRPVVGRALIYWGVLTVGPLLLGASLSLTSWLVTQSMGLMGHLRGAEAVVLEAVPLLLTCIAFAFLYRTVPNRRVQTRDAIVGGAFAGLLFELTKRAFGAYVKQMPTYKLVYGAFASFPIFLTWVYLSWLVVLVGAELTAALPYLRTGGVRVRKAPGSEFWDALQLLRLLHQAHRAGAVPATEDLRASLRLALEDCEELLERLERCGWVAPAAGERWVLSQDAAHIPLAEVYREFAFRSDAPQGSRHGFEHAVARITNGVESELDLTLEELFQQPARAEARVRRARVAS